MLAVKFKSIPIGIAQSRVVRRPSVSAHRPHAYDDSMIPREIVIKYFSSIFGP